MIIMIIILDFQSHIVNGKKPYNFFFAIPVLHFLTDLIFAF